VANYSPDLVFATAINEGAIAMKRALAASTVSLSFLGGAQAATDTTTFKVLLVIRDSCTISTTAAVDVDFGTLDRTTVISNHDASGQLTVKCTPFTNYAIGLNLGANPSGVVRRMAAGPVFVPYELYQDAARSVVWGNAAGSWLTGTGTGADVNVPVYGRVTDINYAPAAYQDTITATVTY
jgi:spore coat protein U-like protein